MTGCSKLRKATCMETQGCHWEVGKRCKKSTINNQSKGKEDGMQLLSQCLMGTDANIHILFTGYTGRLNKWKLKDMRERLVTANKAVPLFTYDNGHDTKTTLYTFKKENTSNTQEYSALVNSILKHENMLGKTVGIVCFATKGTQTSINEIVYDLGNGLNYCSFLSMDTLYHISTYEHPKWGRILVSHFDCESG